MIELPTFPQKADPLSFYEKPLTVSMVHEEKELTIINDTLKKYAISAIRISRRELETKPRDLFQDSFNILSKITEIIATKIDNFKREYPDSRWEGYEVVVCKDPEQRIQAAAILFPKRTESVKEFTKNPAKRERMPLLTSISTEVYLLATAFWNIPSKFTEKIPQKIKGAGTSIIYYASELGKRSGSSGEVTLGTISSSKKFYLEKLGFIKCYIENKPFSKTFLLTPKNASQLSFKFSSVTFEFPPITSDSV